MTVLLESVPSIAIHYQSKHNPSLGGGKGERSSEQVKWIWCKNASLEIARVTLQLGKRLRSPVSIRLQEPGLGNDIISISCYYFMAGEICIQAESHPGKATTHPMMPVTLHVYRDYTRLIKQPRLRPL